MREHDPIISLLADENIVDATTLETLLKRQSETGESVLSLLKRENLASEEQLTKVIATANKIEFINLSPESIDPMVAHLVSQDVASRYNVIPIGRAGQDLRVAMSSPLDLRARDEIELRTGYTVIPVAATGKAIQQAIHYHFDVASVTRQAIASMRLREDTVHEEEGIEHGRTKRFDTADDPISQLVASVVKGAIDASASDIHIEPQESEIHIRYRVDGMLRPAVAVPVSVKAEVISHIKILADMDISERRMPQDGHMTIRHEGREYDLRVSSLPAVGGEKLVLRILDKDVNRWSLDKVVTSPEDNRVFRELLANPYGMLLLTGPTGSGKTTTLYSALQLVNTPERNVVTVEDPVEYRLPGITQVQVKPVAGMTFASALRSILRQDPDVILIGEIRDLETAEIAVSAALTGHLVLSTLHTNDAAGAVSRLVNLGIPPFLVASALLGAAAQRLVRVICPRCREACELEEDAWRRLWGGAKGSERPRAFRGTGCNYCHQTGYQGRKSVYEIFPVSGAIRRLILDGRSDTAFKEQAVKEGMRTLRRGAADEVLRGTTTVEEVTRIVDLKSE